MHASKCLGETAAVYVAENDLAHLRSLANSSQTPGAGLLSRELDRALLIKPGERPIRFARLHSLVEYTDLLTGRTKSVELVPPEEEDGNQDRLSVLSPPGAALLGLTAGATISWTTDDGRPRLLVVNRVQDPRRGNADALVPPPSDPSR